MSRSPTDAELAARYRARARGLEAFERWQEEQPASRSLDSVFRGLGALWRLLPADARARSDDPEYRGIARMHAALSLLGTGGQR